VGLDQSAKMLRLARDRLPDVEFVHAAVPPLPFADQTFNRVFTSFFYGHLSSGAVRRRFAREALRVASELIVVEQAWQAGLPRESWEQRELADGSRHRVFKRYFEAAELADELAGETVLTDDHAVAVRSVSARTTSSPRRSQTVALDNACYVNLSRKPRLAALCTRLAM